MRHYVEDAPLVVFTTLAIAGAGTVAGRPLLAALGRVPWTGGVAEVTLGGGLLCFGLLVSLAHLGRPGRMGQASRGLPRSPLSFEVLLATLGTGAALAAALVGRLAGDAAAAHVAHAVAASLALTFLTCVGLVYRLAGQRTWGGASIVAPATLGLAFGVTLVAARMSGPREVLPCLVLLGLDAAVFAARSRAVWILDGPFVPRQPRLFAGRRPLLALRLTLVDLIPALLLALGHPSEAVSVLAVGVLVDRLVFYGLAAQRTSESEIQHVESVIGSAAGEQG